MIAKILNELIGVSKAVGVVAVILIIGEIVYRIERRWRK